MTYPGLSSDVKTYLWNKAGIPILVYGMTCLNLSKINFCDLESAQGSIFKHVFGINKRSHHSSPLKGLKMTKIDSHVNCETVSLTRRIFLVPSRCRNICLMFLVRYCITGQAPKGTLIIDRPPWPLINLSHSGHGRPFHRAIYIQWSGWSCETQLLTFIHELSKNMSSNEQEDVIIMDFEKAFDKNFYTVTSLPRLGILALGAKHITVLKTFLAIDPKEY